MRAKLRIGKEWGNGIEKEKVRRRRDLSVLRDECGLE